MRGGGPREFGWVLKHAGELYMVARLVSALCRARPGGTWPEMPLPMPGAHPPGGDLGRLRHLRSPESFDSELLLQLLTGATPPEKHKQGDGSHNACQRPGYAEEKYVIR
jgi:hypothetical protein